MIFPSKNVRIDSLLLKCLRGGSWCRINHKVTELHADKVRINFFIILLPVASLASSQVTLLASSQVSLGVKNGVNFVGGLRFRGGQESFGFKKLLELVWTLVYVFCRSIK